ncbi:NUDIX family hydrolase [Jeotgalibacillus malaysiensis]|uniref:NUDIX family hydrolase n=1 Tax=Jeotgalibacillus malaysiensis TaxID=1508404 RepID=A0A0B5ARA4_9BACL|nr:CoA pyrophosphatase [Jeotgalibacillus malaysiensis]AJD92785.1 NUDIX family hydrolase [Jeotgalibacillus malaysiensis]
MEEHKIIERLQAHEPIILGEEAVRNYSILIPFIKKEDGLHLLFEVRSLTMRRQPGEICFPGGKVDRDDDSAKGAAIREAREELGLRDASIGRVYSFGKLVSPFGMTISTYVGFIDQESEIQPNPSEVEEVFTVPLSYFLNEKPDEHIIKVEVKPEDGFPYELIANGREYKWQTRQYSEYFYHYEGRVIWGLTARVLREFVDKVLKKE